MVSELDRLADQVERLERRLASIRRQRWGFLVGIAAISATAFNSGPQDLTVRSLTVLGAGGKRAALIIADDNGGQINVYGSSGGRAVTLGVDNSAGYADWYGSDSERRATVFTGASGAGQFQFMNLDRLPVAVIGGDAEGGFFNVRSNPGRIASYMEVDKNGNGIAGVYAGSDGARRSIMGVDESGVGAVQVFDSTGKSRGRLP